MSTTLAVVSLLALVVLCALLAIFAGICAWRAARIESRVDELVAAERRRAAGGTRAS